MDHSDRWFGTQIVGFELSDCGLDPEMSFETPISTKMVPKMVPVLDHPNGPIFGPPNGPKSGPPFGPQNGPDFGPPENGQNGQNHLKLAKNGHFDHFRSPYPEKPVFGHFWGPISYPKIDPKRLTILDTKIDPLLVPFWD